MKRFALPVLLVAVLALAACMPIQPEAPSATPAQEPAVTAPADIVETAVAAGSFNTLAAALQAAGLVDALKGDGPFTVFAPTDEAFAKLPAGTVESLLADPSGALTDVLLYHVVEGAVRSTDLSDGMEAPTLNGAALTFALADGAVRVNDSTVVAADVEASNGIIHVIDTVLLPPAPEAAAEEPVAEAPALKDLVDTAVDAGSFPTLVQLVQAAGLVDALKGEGPFTVFAPTEEAFAAVDPATLEALLADPTGLLQQVLLYHVVEGAVLSTDLTDGLSVNSLQGSPVTFMLHEGSVMINDANVVAADIHASNGVIHVIDRVILPPQ